MKRVIFMYFVLAHLDVVEAVEACAVELAYGFQYKDSEACADGAEHDVASMLQATIGSDLENDDAKAHYVQTGCTGQSKRYIAVDGSDSNDGCSLSSSLKTLSACVTKTGDGGTCYFAPGQYFIQEEIRHVKDLTIAPVPGSIAGSVIFDGTQTIAGWTKNGNTYRSDTPQTAWQLFVDGEPLTSARWPNAQMWTEDAWTPERSWARQAEGTNCGHSVDAGTELDPSISLAATGVSMNGCNVVMNNEHWVTRRYVVKNHTAGTGTFDYDAPTDRNLCDKYADDTARNQYYIDGCLAALDSPGEWAYDSGGHIVVHPPAYVDFDVATIRGKVQTYALSLIFCDRVKVQNIKFVGTALFVFESSHGEVSGNEFQYPSASRRALGGHAVEFNAGNTEYPDLKWLVKHDSKTTFTAGTRIWVPTNFFGVRAWRDSSYLVSDNIVNRSEGAGFFCWHCTGDIFENNELYECGYPFAGSIQYFAFRGHQIIRYNTVGINGAGGIANMWGTGCNATMNRVYGNGKLITDNECIGGGTPTVDSTFSYNWIHDSTSLGLRFDSGEDGRFPADDNLLFNVAWNCLQGGIANKANKAMIYRNTAIGNQGGSDPESAGAFGSAADFKIAKCYPFDCVATGGKNAGRPNSAVTNNGSIIRGNVGQMTPGTKGLTPAQLPGTHDHNINLLVEPQKPTLDELFRDWKNWDFRPISGSVLVDQGDSIPDISDTSVLGSAPDIGAYEDGSSVYWIPGRRLTKASTPVPPSAATGVRPNADLMFLPAKGAVSHEIFIGTSTDNLASEGILTAPHNIFDPTHEFVPNTMYYWRVDAKTASGQTTRSDTWSFTAGCADLNCKDCGSSTALNSCIVCESPMVLSQGICGPEGGCAGGSWSITATPGKYGKTYETTVTASFTDKFEVVVEPSAGCGKFKQKGKPLGQNVVYHKTVDSSERLAGLSCSNQDYTLTSTFACLKCASGFVSDTSMASGCRNNAVPAGGCLEKPVWKVTATPSNYGSVWERTMSGSFADKFQVVTEPSAGCAKYSKDGKPLQQNFMYHKTANSSKRIAPLSCSNQDYAITSTWKCLRCANGFVSDSSMPFGCRTSVH